MSYLKQKRMDIDMIDKKRLTALGLSLLLTASFLSGCDLKKSLPSLKSDEQESEIQSGFDAYMDELFEEEVTLNTVSLHYTLADPAAYGINDYEPSLGSVSEDSLSESITLLENMRSSLEDYPYQALRTDQKLTYDILDDYSELELDNTDLYLYSEVLQPSTGTHTQLPILLAEYSFRCEKDVTDYLELLSMVPAYFEEIASFEKSKAEAGLFMSKKNASTVISQCEQFTEHPESNFLLETFDNRIEQLTTLSSAAKEEYRSQNESYVINRIIPAYENLAKEIKSLKKQCSTKGGLCNYENGEKYYEYLVRSSTGSSDSVKDLQKRVEQKRREDMSSLSTLLTKHPELAKESQTYELDTSDPSQILKHLRKEIKKDFPKAPDANFTVKYVDEALEDYLSPAFYLTSPIDDYKENSIYINEASNYDKMKLFTTLAHEGFPGHLYQNVMANSSNLPAIRHLLNYSGYAEGWATYVEMISYQYAGLDEDLASVLQLNQAIMLSLYASMDMGIHYQGWDASDVKTFLADYGINSAAAASETYEYILGEPANYLKYYIGYLEFLDLQKYAKNALGESYTDKAFHEAVLKIGPAPFEIIKKYLMDYISD